jgi:hypothetical protein
MPDDLDSAAADARYLAHTAASIRAMRAADAPPAAIKWMLVELNKRLPAAREAIDPVRAELRLTRDRAVRLGDIVAPTAHEAAVKMVYALNREWCGVDARRS